MASSNDSLPPPSLIGSSTLSPVVSPLDSPAPIHLVTRVRARTASIASSPSFRDRPVFEDE